MNYEYHSGFCKDIKSFISFKTSLGFSESSYAKFMHNFDSFCANKYPLIDNLTQAIVDEWASPRTKEQINGVKRRLYAIRQFGQYLCYIGKCAYVVPSKHIGDYLPFTPYIYDDVELKAFFAAADSIKPSKLAPYREHIVPILFRLLYCCGLRASEVRHIRCADIHYDNGVLKISESKGHRDRNVVLSQDILKLCREYEQNISARHPNRRYFFEHPNGEAYTANWVQRQFWVCWKKSGITFRDRRKPRVSDWRHNYATRIMSKWLNEKRDINALLPYLSEYMGHSSLESSAYYIRLLPERIRTDEFLGMANLFPDVPNG